MSDRSTYSILLRATADDGEIAVATISICAGEPIDFRNLFPSFDSERLWRLREAAVNAVAQMKPAGTRTYVMADYVIRQTA